MAIASGALLWTDSYLQNLSHTVSVRQQASGTSFFVLQQEIQSQ